MKKNVKIIIIVLAVAIVGYFAVQVFGGALVNKTLDRKNSLDRGLMGHWTFDGRDMDMSSTTAEVLDSSGNNKHGNMINF